MRTKRLPSDWTSAHISAVHKKGEKSDLSNYQPISLTSIVCKIMEGLLENIF